MSSNTPAGQYEQKSTRSMRTLRETSLSWLTLRAGRGGVTVARNLTLCRKRPSAVSTSPPGGRIQNANVHPWPLARRRLNSRTGSGSKEQVGSTVRSTSAQSRVSTSLVTTS